MITIQHCLILSILLFTIGAIGVVVRRSVLIILMSTMVMFGSAVLALLTFARWNLLPEGKAIVPFIIALVVAEVGVGLSIVVAVFRKKGSISVDKFRFLRG